MEDRAEYHVGGVRVEDLYRLHDPFAAKDIEWRIVRAFDDGSAVSSALAVAYISARAVHARLDEVCGPQNWTLEYRSHGEGSIARIGINIEGRWVFKEGGAAPTQIESFKGMLSGAEKRAAVPWGIGRYLYDLDETWVNVTMQRNNAWNRGVHKRRGKTDLTFWWETPQLPDWAIPSNPNGLAIDVAVAEFKAYVSESQWQVFNQELRNEYKTGDIQSIVSEHGRKILFHLKERKFKFQKEV